MENPDCIFFINTENGTPVTVHYWEKYIGYPHAEFHGEITSTGFMSHYWNEPIEGDIEAACVEAASLVEKEFLRECNSFYRAKKFSHEHVIGGLYKLKDKREINVCSTCGSRWTPDKVYRLLAVKKEGSLTQFLLQCPSEKNPNFCYAHEVELIQGCAQMTLAAFL